MRSPPLMRSEPLPYGRSGRFSTPLRAGRVLPYFPITTSASDRATLRGPSDSIRHHAPYIKYIRAVWLQPAALYQTDTADLAQHQRQWQCLRCGQASRVVILNSSRFAELCYRWTRAMTIERGVLVPVRVYGVICGLCCGRSSRRQRSGYTLAGLVHAVLRVVRSSEPIHGICAFQ